MAMDTKFKQIVNFFGKDRFKFDEPLKYHTALSIGGPSKLFFIAFTTSEIIKLVNMCRELKVPFLIFGTGSKLMVADEDFARLVIKNCTKNINTVSVKGKVSKTGVGIDEALIEVDSGVSISKFAEYLDSQGLSTSGFFGIPGSIGGNLFISQVLQSKVKSIKVLDLSSQVEEIGASQLRQTKHIILSAVFRIKAKS